MQMKLQRLMVDAGFTCPNRDGRVGFGGCTFCRNDSFCPSYCNPSQSITAQLEAGKRFFAGKYPEMKYIAYFQAYTNTYGSIEELKKKYEEALSVKNVIGIIIGTRPDCMPDELLDYLQKLSKKYAVTVEYGIESCYDKTLEHINRGHDFACAADAIRRTAERGLDVGAHIIFGLPGETKDDIINEAEILNTLPINFLKIHQLQILQDTQIAKEFAEYPERFLNFSAEEYAQLVASFIKTLNADIHVERFASESPKDMLIAPKWGLKPVEVENLVKKYLHKNDNVTN